MAVNVTKTNSKGIDAAIDMVEKAIAHLEKKAAAAPKHTVPKELPNEQQPKLKKKIKKPKKCLAGALVRHSKPVNSSSCLKRRSCKLIQNGENETPSEEGSTISGRAKSPKFTSRKVRHGVGNIPSRPQRYAEATLSFQMKVQKRKARQPPLKSLQLPFVSSASQHKSHNLGTIIQENLARLQQKDFKKNGCSSDPITRDAIQAAVENVEREIRRVKRKS